MVESTLASLEGDRVRFGSFFLYLSARQLRHNATPVPLKPKQVELLALLAERLGKPVSRDEIMKKLWGPQKASDYALSQTVYRLRRALEAFDPSTDHVSTVSGFGFRLVASTPTSERANKLLFRDPAFQPCRQAMLLLKGHTQANILESIGFFEDALTRNPTFVPALVGIAQGYTSAGIRSFIDPLTAYYHAKAALASAVALDPTNADAFTQLSMLALFFDANLARARDAAELAVALDPHSPKARGAMVWQLLARADFSAALDEAGRALRANPIEAHIIALPGIALYLSQRYDKACQYFAESLPFAPDYAPALFYCACAHYMRQRYDEALSLLDRMPGSELVSRELALRGCIAVSQGRESIAKHIESRLAALPFRADISIAAIHIAREDLERAAASLTRAFDTREPGLFVPPIDPIYEPLQHSHPQLMATIRRGRQSCCNRCAVPLAQDDLHRLHALSLCDDCCVVA